MKEIEFEVHPHGGGWAIPLDGLPLVLRAEGGVTPKGSVRATVELWRKPENGHQGALIFADEAALSKDKDRERLAEAFSKKAGAAVPAEALLALCEAIRQAPPPERDNGKSLQGQAVELPDPEPWPDPVAGAELLDELAAIFRRFVALPPHADTALALWVLHTHAHDAADVSPRLALTSPTKRCGKTTALTLLGALVRRPLPSANITAAALFRAVEAYRPTVLVDEADTWLEALEELRGLLNAGHTRGTAYVIRTVGDDHEVRAFSVWAPVAVALIGELPSTLADRSIIVPMRRRRPDEHIDKLRLDRLGELEPLRRRAWRWALDHLEALRAADPEEPDGLHDRAADNWRPLLAIADLAGGLWPDRAREAAKALSGVTDDADQDVRILLLSDIRNIFKQQGKDRLPTDLLLSKLNAMQERPWPEWRGRPLTARGLARLLQPFGVKPKAIRVGDATPRGYLASDFEEVFARYLTPSEVQHPQQANNGAGLGDFSKRNTTRAVALHGEAANPHESWDVADVADTNPGVGHEEDGDAFEFEEVF